jgi:hypothetical protein
MCERLYLTICVDLALQFDEFIGAVIDVAEHFQPRRTPRLSAEQLLRGMKLRLNTGRRARNQIDDSLHPSHNAPWPSSGDRA